VTAAHCSAPCAVLSAPGTLLAGSQSHQPLLLLLLLLLLLGHVLPLLLLLLLLLVPG
jgi:hypothetical protein